MDVQTIVLLASDDTARRTLFRDVVAGGRGNPLAEAVLVGTAPTEDAVRAFRVLAEATAPAP